MGGLLSSLLLELPLELPPPLYFDLSSEDPPLALEQEDESLAMHRKPKISGTEDNIREILGRGNKKSSLKTSSTLIEYRHQTQTNNQFDLKWQFVF